MAPKTLAIQFSEKTTLLLAAPLYWFGKLMYPFIWALNGASRVLLRAFGVKPAPHEQAYTEEELRIVMAQSFQGGEINGTKLAYMENVFSFDERVAKDIMVPRTDLITLDKSMEYPDIVRILMSTTIRGTLSSRTAARIGWLASLMSKRCCPTSWPDETASWKNSFGTSRSCLKLRRSRMPC